jgi:hypothetical protein
MKGKLIRPNTKEHKRLSPLTRDIIRVLIKHAPEPEDTMTALAAIVSMMLHMKMLEGDVDDVMAKLTNVVRINVEFNSAEGEA